MMQGTHDDVRRTLIMEQAKLVIVTNDRKIRGQKVLPSKEKVVNIDANKTPHASLQCAPSGVVLSGDGEKSQEDVIKPRFNKPALGVDNLADLLIVIVPLTVTLPLLNWSVAPLPVTVIGPISTASVTCGIV